MFFHANDAQGAVLKSQASPPNRSKSQPFIYGNGIQKEQKASSTPLANTPPQPQGQFFHAYDVSEREPGPARAWTTPSPSVTRPMQKPVPFVSSPHGNVIRSASPLKEFENASQLHQEVDDQASSTLSSTLHGKSLSYSALDTSSNTQTGLDLDTHGRISDASSSFDSDPESLGEPPSSSDVVVLAPMSPMSPLVSPTHSVIGLASPDTPQSSKLEQVQALAAQARRERKVLDLEISNSSLLAINRTMEREMRKQKAELRRYKRLTSSGRISSLSVNESRSSFAGTTASDLSPIEGSDEEYNEIDDDEAGDLSISSEDSTVSSEAATANGESFERRREKDAKRLRLDLARHGALLADSQALNQSIKRCLGWTAALISNGKRALAHKVRISEVHVGGRVLDADEVGEDIELDQRRHGLLSPGLASHEAEAQDYRWDEPIKDSRDPSSPQSPFRGIVPFVRQASVDKVLTRAALDTDRSPTRELSPVRQPSALSQSSPTRPDILTRPSLACAVTTRNHEENPGCLGGRP